MKLKQRMWEILEAAGRGDTTSRRVDIFILTLILLNVTAVIVGTIEPFATRAARLLQGFEVFSVVIFTIEYVGRLWACVCDRRFRHPVAGRLRFAARPLAVIDLLAFLPFYLPLVGIDLRFMRVLRLMRIARILKIGRYSSSLQLLVGVLKDKREELLLTTGIMAMLLVTASCLVYYCESSVQPDAFPNIPAAMWWAVATLTTVGYGDVTPVTPLGRGVASIVAILGIGMFALPTGVLGAGFVEAIQKRKDGEDRCPHCGKPLS